jgi:predicted GNAT superfamily acetyltransferase
VEQQELEGRVVPDPFGPHAVGAARRAHRDLFNATAQDVVPTRVVEVAADRAHKALLSGHGAARYRYVSHPPLQCQASVLA